LQYSDVEKQKGMFSTQKTKISCDNSNFYLGENTFYIFYILKLHKYK